MNKNAVLVTQKPNDFNPLKKNVAFRHWLKKLGRKDTLPRGKFFKGKVGGAPIIIFDEAHFFLNKHSTVN